MANRVELEFTGEDRGAGELLERLQREIDELRARVEALGGKPIDLPTDPAEADVRRLVAELARLDAAFQRAQNAVNFQRARNEIEGTAASARASRIPDRYWPTRPGTYGTPRPPARSASRADPSPPRPAGAA